MFLILNVISFPAFIPPNPWCKLSIGVLHCVPNLLLRKHSNGFPLNKHICNKTFWFSEVSFFLLTYSNLTLCLPKQAPIQRKSVLRPVLLVFLSVSQTRAASLSPPPYVVILISCSGLVSFVLLLLTCLCCKRGGVGFNVSLQHVRDLFTSFCFLDLLCHTVCARLSGFFLSLICATTGGFGVDMKTKSQ